MYNDSNLAHIDVVVASLTTSLKTLSPRHKTMTLLALSIISSFSACVKLAGIAASPFNASTHFCCVNTACILTLHNPKSLHPVNFSMSHFEPMIPTLPIYAIALRWAPIVVNSDKITPMNKVSPSNNKNRPKSKCRATPQT